MRILRLEQTRFSASIVALALWLFLMGLLLPVGGVFIGLMPFLALLLPAALTYIAFLAGRITALGCAASGIVLAAILGGTYWGLGAALVLLPVPVYSVYTYERKLPFWQSVGVCVGLLIVSAMGLLLLANALCGGDIAGALRAQLEAALRQSPQLDYILVSLANIGFVRIPEETFLASQLEGLLALPSALREELLKQFLLYVESLVRQTMANQVLQGAMLGGLLSVYGSRRVAAKRTMQMELAPVTPFHQWHIPHRPGWALILTALIIGMLPMFSSAPETAAVSDLLWGGTSLVLALQGGSLLAFMMRRGGMRVGTRTAVVILLLVLFQFLLVLAGCVDQLSNPRKLRPPMPGRRDEEDKR